MKELLKTMGGGTNYKQLTSQQLSFVDNFLILKKFNIDVSKRD